MSEGHIAQPPSRKRLLALLGMALLTAALIVMGAVLPAEYHVDPLGVGRITGLLQLSRPREVTLTLPAAHVVGAPARFYEHELRNDRIDIPLAAGGDSERRDAVEWKVRMKAGDTMVFSWTVAAPANEFYFDFHGQSDPSPEVKVLSYREGLGNRSSGTMTAAFDGIHGWFLQNQSTVPVVVHLELSGFYQMRPDPYAPE
jgi:hypothetical protein